MEALVTEELQLCGDLLFFLGFCDRIQHKVDVLLGSGLVCNYTVVVLIANDREVQHTLLGEYVRNVCYPLLIRSFGGKISV